MMKTKIRQVISIIAVLLLAITVNNCSSDKAENNGDKSAPPAFMNGIDENTYLALWSAKTYSTTDGQLIPAADLPYKYFASKGVNFARIRVWAGTASDGNYANALANGLAAKEAGLKTLLVIFLSEQWPDNIGCDPLKVAAIFRNLTFAEKKAAIQEYTGQLIQNFKNDGLQFDLYAVDNEVLNCVCGETDKANMADLLNTAYDAIRAVDPNAKFVFHAPHLAPADALAFFNEMIATYKVRCDYLSTSFYPLQYGSTAFADYKKFVDDLYAAHGKPFIISEWSYSHSPLPSNSIWITSGVMQNTPLTGYPQSAQGQADLVRDLLLWAKGSNGKVAGVFYWSPMFNVENYDQNTDTYYGWLWLSLFDINGKAKPALEALSYGLEHGPVFYVDAAGGSDGNSGTDPGSPWKSLAKISGSQFLAGSTIYLKRGSTWNEQLTIPASGVTIDAYGTGPLPFIDGSRDITVWTAQGSGLYSSASITLGADEALGNLSENGEMMSFLTWTADAATTFSGAPDGTYSYAYPSTLYIKSALSPSGKAYRASVKIYGITATSKSDVIVKNVEITRFSLHGVHFQDCVRCGVHDSVITKGGGATIAPNLYAGNGIEFDNSSASGVVEGVTVSDIFDSGISPQTWLSNQTMSSISIRNSQISTCGFAGIEVSVLSNGSTTNSSITGVLISGMTITAAGRGWSGRRYGTEGHGIRVKADNGAGSMSGVQLDTTSVSGSMGDGVKLAGDIGAVSLNRMNISNNSYGISLEEPSETSVKLRLISSLVHHNVGYGIIYNSPTAAGFELFQNTFSDNAGINLAVLNWNGTATAKIRNNIFYGSSAMTHLYSAPTLTGAVIDNNCYNEFVTNTIGYGGLAYSTVAAFNGATGYELNGIGGVVDMTNPSAGDFTLLNSSAGKALGSSSVGVAVDYSGYPFSTPPSSGAYQYR